MLELNEKLVNKLIELNYKITFAESCTGGMIISKLINVSGSSNVINESYVTYSNDSKMKILGVKKGTISKYGVASIEVAEEMVEGLCKVSKSEVGIAVTGFAGSAGNKIDDGVYYFAIKIKDYVYLEKHVVFGPRNECRASQTRYILWRLNTLLKTFK